MNLCFSSTKNEKKNKKNKIKKINKKKKKNTKFTKKKEQLEHFLFLHSRIFYVNFQKHNPLQKTFDFRLKKAVGTILTRTI